MTLHLGDCLDVLKTLPDASVDAVVTDPPYELGFMGKKWDAAGIAYNVELWTEALRVLKPGGHLLAFGGTRTYHRMACAIEDAGFEIRDSLHWVYGSGFPKSLDVSKAIDKAAGAEREVVGVGPYVARRPNGIGVSVAHGDYGTAPGHVLTAPATDAARQWNGWGTALKPAHEPVVVARKPLAGTVADNVQQHGTGALNIDGCRVATEDNLNGGAYSGGARPTSMLGATGEAGGKGSMFEAGGGRLEAGSFEQPSGRWPPNILLSHTPECGETCDETCPVAEMDRQSGTLKSGVHAAHHQRHAAGGNGQTHGTMAGVTGQSYGDSGGASRFFPVFRYQAKASRKEREAGLDALPAVSTGMSGGAQSHGEGYDQGQGIGLNRVVKVKNHHPTVKPIALMEWLCTLVTPPNGTVLDPFTGSGTTGIAALNKGFDFIGIEREPEYHAIATARIEHARGQQPAQAELFSA